MGERLFMCTRTCIHVSVPLDGSSGGRATRGKRERGCGGAGVLCGEALSSLLPAVRAKTRPKTCVCSASLDRILEVDIGV